MTPHDVERLAAYLDRELPAEDRAAVEAHLRECPDCSGRLGELAAVDATARALPAGQPPAGYFESFPSLVRGRLLATRPAIRLGRPWLLAAAAALLLAVLTPATLRDLSAPAVVGTETAPGARLPDAAPGARKTELEAAAPPAPAGAAEPSAGSPPEPQPRQQASNPSSPPAEFSDSRPAAPRPARQDGSDRFAADHVLEERPLAAEAARPASPTPASPAPGPYGFATAPTSADRATATVTAEGGATAPAGTEAVAPPAMAERKRERPRTSAAKAASERDLREEVAGRVEAGDLEGGEQTVSAAQSRYESLLARPVTSAEDARALREAWRAFSADHSDGPWADEARVRVVEVGADAYRRGGDPEDLALVRRDAAQYLKLGRATQARRVLEVLRSLR